MSISTAVTSHHQHLYHGRSDAAVDTAAPAIATAPQASLDASGPSAASAAFAALLSRVGLSGTEGQTGAATPPDESADGAETPVKPNLDALNRVLNHYRAQSDAVGVTVSLAS